ncbi:hypothetical protein [Candidatus Chrysopegis kryptomonas]|jgi:hypothetical protein|uniref:Lipoprotein n=1 Tax=Candidatus Chryseopegocella kryptomonas TaxID=1633643 RepID=A0A0P1MTD2_9BACT|nr:hypothetical protein [Candidatus Chrysopegis kryptomonas]CUS99049.1 hypothetical protein JGI23_00591 [Candidatus Chrysopegis kryptomonas]
MKIKFSIILVLIFLSGCAYLLEENYDKMPEPTKVVLAVKETLATVVKDSIKISVKLLTPEEIRKLSAGKVYDKKDFEKILKDEYINYAEEDNAEILSAYNEYMHIQEYGNYYDVFGNPISPRNIPSPFEDDFGKIPYLIFDVRIENMRNDKIEIKPSLFVLLDDRRNQFRTLEIDDIIQTETVPYPMRYITPYTIYDPFWAGYLLTSQRRTELNKKFLREILLRDEKIYPGVVRRGIVVFRKPKEKVKWLLLVIPEIAIYDENVKTKEIDFKFEFVNEN